MNAEQIIEDAIAANCFDGEREAGVHTIYSLATFLADAAESVACALREAGIDLDHIYQQRGWFDEGRWYDESTYMWTVNAWDADDGLTPLFVRRLLDGAA